METAPLTPAARKAVEALLDSPTTQTEQAGADGGVRMLLDGLGVQSIRELKQLVDTARAHDEVLSWVQL